MKRTLLALALLLAPTTGCAAESTGNDQPTQPEAPDVGSTITAEIMCEKFIAQKVGQQLDDLDFEHRDTSSDSAPSYSVRGQTRGGGLSAVYQCDVTFDGDETWTLDDLQLL